jgi:hypothetical protein
MTGFRREILEPSRALFEESAKRKGSERYYAKRILEQKFGVVFPKTPPPAANKEPEQK